MNRILKSVLAGLAFVVLVTVGGASGAQAGQAPPQAKPAGDPVQGAAIYKKQNCALCHRVGTTGGKMGPELTKVGAKRDRVWLQKYLVNPKAENPKNMMPPVKTKGEDLDHLIAYMLSLK